MTNITIAVQKPRIPEFLTASLPAPAPEIAVCSAVKLIIALIADSTSMRTDTITDSSSTPNHAHTRTLSGPLK